MEALVEDSAGTLRKTQRVVKRFGPGTYFYTKGLPGRDNSGVQAQRIKSLTDVKVRALWTL